jgi:hypothetical protein
MSSSFQADYKWLFMCSWMVSSFPNRKWNYYATHVNITHYLFSQVLTFEVTTSQRLSLDLVWSVFKRNQRRCFFSEGHLMNDNVSSLLAVKLTCGVYTCTVCALVQSVLLYSLYTCTVCSCFKQLYSAAVLHSCTVQLFCTVSHIPLCGIFYPVVFAF